MGGVLKNKMDALTGMDSQVYIAGPHDIVREMEDMGTDIRLSVIFIIQLAPSFLRIRMKAEISFNA